MMIFFVLVVFGCNVTQKALVDSVSVVFPSFWSWRSEGDLHSDSRIEAGVEKSESTSCLLPCSHPFLVDEGNVSYWLLVTLLPLSQKWWWWQHGWFANGFGMAFLRCCSQKLEPLLIELAHKLYNGEGCSEYGGGKLMNVGITGLSSSCTVLQRE